MDLEFYITQVGQTAVIVFGFRFRSDKNKKTETYQLEVRWRRAKPDAVLTKKYGISNNFRIF